VLTGAKPSADLEVMIGAIVETLAPALLARNSIGHESAAQPLLTAGDNVKRLRSELAITAPARNERRPPPASIEWVLEVMCSALLAARSPPRLGRWRVTLPDDAGNRADAAQRCEAHGEGDKCTVLGQRGTWLQ